MSEAASTQKHTAADEPVLCFTIAGVDDIRVHELSGENLISVNTRSGFEALPGVGRARFTRTLEGAAHHIRRRIRLIQAHGPYRVAAAGIFGILACEVVAQLIGEDESVEFVGLIDHPASADLGAAAVRVRDLHSSVLTSALGVPADFAAGPQWLTLMQTFSQKVDDRLIRVVSAELDLKDEQSPCDKRGLPSWASALVTRRVSVTFLSPTEFHALLPRSLARGIRQAQELAEPHAETAYSPHVIIQQGSQNRTPLFCVPGAGDNGAVFTDLSAALGRDYPVYALQARGLDGRLNPHTSVTAAAEQCARAIMALRPDGRIHITGHSFGGWVAFEVARLLSDWGREIASLTLVDTEPPHTTDEIREFSELDVYGHLIRVLEFSAGRSLGIAQSDFVPLDRERNLSVLHRGVVHAGLMSSRANPRALAGPLNTFSAALRTSYVPTGSYEARLNLALVEDPKLSFDTNLRLQRHTVTEWRRYAPNATPWHGPGNHFTILRPPHVLKLAEWWRDISGES